MESAHSKFVKIEGTKITVEADGLDAVMQAIDELQVKKVEFAAHRVDLDRRLSESLPPDVRARLEGDRNRMVVLDQTANQVFVQIGDVLRQNNIDPPQICIAPPVSEIPPMPQAPELEDTEENYRRHLAFLISRTRSRGRGRYFNKFLGRCREEAAAQFPKGAKAAHRKDVAAGGLLAGLGALLSFFG